MEINYNREKLIELLEREGVSCPHKIADSLITSGVVVLPIPIGTTIWEIREYYSQYDNSSKFDFTQVEYQPFKNGGHAVLLNTGVFSYKRTYFDTLEHAIECFKQKVRTGEWDDPICIGAINGSHHPGLYVEIREELHRLLSTNNWR